eukprot:g463.t1
MIELGDFKDTVCPGPNAGHVAANCTDATLGFIDTIEGAMAAFQGPRFHVLGNHDVDVLNQSSVLAHVHNYGSGSLKTEGHYSFAMPFPNSSAGGQQADAIGCLVTDAAARRNVWVIHEDGTRNWVSKPTAGCASKAAAEPAAAIDAIPKRHGATSPLYSLDQAHSDQACAINPSCAELPSPAPPPALKFIVLNGDFNANGTAWYDLDGAPTLPFAWDEAWVSGNQIEWFAEELDAAKAAGQKAIVFVHYRLDGGPTGIVDCGPDTPCGEKNNRAWVDDCTLKNAAVVRDIIEASGVVLATFSGHDHVPIPAYSVSSSGGGNTLYFTHAGLVEGPISTSNAYSVVDVMDDCTVSVRGFGNATSVVHRAGGPGCTVGKKTSAPQPDPLQSRLAVTASAWQRHMAPVMLDMPPRFMWGWEPKVSGYCGSVSVQTAAIYHGNWLTEDAIRATSGGRDGKHELLLGFAKDLSIKHASVFHACEALAMNCTRWDYHSAPTPQTDAFVAWARAAIDRGLPVIMGVYWGVESNDDYDHIVPLRGYDATALYYNDLHTNATLRGELGPAFVRSRAQCVSEDRFGPQSFCLPSKVNYGVVVHGNNDPRNELQRVRLAMDSWTEPDYSREDAQREAPTLLTALAIVSGVRPGKRYALLRFEDATTVPQHTFLDGPYTDKTEFVAPAGGTYQQRVSMMSDSTVFFRCVEIKRGAKL